MRRYSLYNFYIGILIGLTVILVVGNYFTAYFQRKELIERAVEEKIRFAATIDETLASLIVRQRLYRAFVVERTFIFEMAKFPEIIFLRIVDINGEISHSNLEDELGQPVENLEQAKAEISKVIITKEVIVKDVFFKNQKQKLIIHPAYGDRTIWIAFSTQKIEQITKTVALRSFLISSGMLFFVALFAFVGLRLLINPLRRITATSEEIRKGNLDVKIDIKSGTEIGELAGTFNEMVKGLRESRTALEESKAVLEIKVRARTRELKDLNDNLEEEVRRRTKEVHEKMEQLERFQKIAVGRELKMIELKKELAEALLKKTKKNHGSQKKES